MSVCMSIKFGKHKKKVRLRNIKSENNVRCFGSE